MAILKFIVKSIYKVITGGAAIFLFNLIASGIFEFQVALNIISASLVGFLGLPGLLLFICLKIIY